MNQDVSYMLTLAKEVSRITNELEERGIAFTFLTEQEISVLLKGKGVVVSNDWLESLLSMQQQ